MTSPDTKRCATMRDIAEALDVSVSAVSLALNNKPGIAPELREKVFETARRLGYPLDKLQERRASGAELGFLINREFLRGGDPQYARMLGEAQAEAEARGYHLMIGALTPQEARAGKLPQFFGNGVSGVIVDDGFDEAYVLKRLRERVPVVLFGYDFLDVHLDSVKAADLSGAAAAVRHLVRTGHRRIGLIWAVPQHSNMVRRRHGYLIALEQSGLETDPRLISEPAPVSTAENGYRAAMELVQREGVNLDAIFCVTDELATGCLKALQELGLAVPHDISVMGFDDMSWVCHLTPPLTTMHVPSLEMGRRAVQRLIDLVEAHRRGKSEEPVSIELPVRLVARESVAKRKKAAPAVAQSA